MAIVIRQKSVIFIECTVQVRYEKFVSDCFTFQDRQCSLTFEYTYCNYARLSFESAEELNPAVDVRVVVTSDRRKDLLVDRRSGITGKNQVIWSTAACRKLYGSLLTFEIIFFDNLSKEQQSEAMSSNCLSQEVRVQPTDSRTNIHLEALSRDFLKMLDESSNCDLEITCEDKTFKAHRIVLGARSTVFSAMLKSNMIEGETGQINVEYTKSTTFQNFLCYLYSGMLPKLDVENAQQLYEVGDKYAVEELKKACSEFLVNNLSEDNACELVVLADRHNDQYFRDNVISYIIDKNIPRRDNGWSDFCENHSKLAIEVLNLYIQKNCPN